MTDYELLLAIQPVTVEQEDRILSGWDAVLGGHASSTLLTITASGLTVEGALRSVTEDLGRVGVQVDRLVEDLVTRGVIAARAGVTPQAVGLWARGERHLGNPFPAPYSLAAGGLWLWGEVNAWLRLTGQPADDIDYPSREDYAHGNVWLLGNRASTARPRTVASA